MKDQKEIITIESVTKKFENVTALNDINLNINFGEIFGLIGPDGAGKTTLFRILTTLLLADKGKINVLGLDIEKDYKMIRKKIGYMPGKFSLYQDLTVKENLNFFASVFGTTIEKNYDLIKGIYQHIEPFEHRKAGALSGGMKQKLALSCALIHKPEVLFLDEPTTGVDAVSRKEFWEMLFDLKEKGITIMVSTPYMDEASMCDRVALIYKGDILNVETPQKIVENHLENTLAISAKRRFKLIEDLHKFYDAKTIFTFGEDIHFTSRSNRMDEEFINEIKSFLIEQGNEDVSVSIAKINIEDCFMSLMISQNQKNKRV